MDVLAPAVAATALWLVTAACTALGERHLQSKYSERVAGALLNLAPTFCGLWLVAMALRATQVGMVAWFVAFAAAAAAWAVIWVLVNVLLKRLKAVRRLMLTAETPVGAR